jgi:hypothetical protein
MNATTFQAPTCKGVIAMPNQQTQLTPELADIVRKIRALRVVTKTTGFVTNRTIGEMLQRLTPDDLVAVGEGLELKSGEVKHIQVR